MKSKFAILLFLITVLLVTNATAQNLSLNKSKRITIIGRTAATVTKKEVTLADVAAVNSPTAQDDQAIIAIRRIFLKNSPKAGNVVEITANSILDKLRENAVNLDMVGYALPKVITVTRSFRELQEEEVVDVIEKHLRQLNQVGRDVVLKKVYYDNKVKIAPGLSKLSAEVLDSSNSGKHQFLITAKVENEEDLRFQLAADVDEWGEVPVAARSFNKGGIIDQSDYVMARMNLKFVPKDAISEAKTLIGKELTQNLNFGEVFRKSKLSIPPVVTTGARVKILYESGILQASALGTALQNGLKGDLIQVRNDSSRKILEGIVKDASTVRIIP